MELRRHTGVNWFVSPIGLVDVPSALLGPVVCWYRPAGSRVVSVLDSGAEGPGFISHLDAVG